jgi:hypothetical protein
MAAILAHPPARRRRQGPSTQSVIISGRTLRNANTIALSTNDGQAYTTSFNPATLATADEFGMCDGVPPRLCP